MKKLFIIFVLAFLSISVEANTNVCTQAKSEIQDFQIFGKCIIDIPPDDQTD